SVGVDPVAQGAVMDTKISRYLRDRLAGLDDHLHRFSLELRAEPATLLGHEHILSIERHCPRSLVHPKPLPHHWRSAPPPPHPAGAAPEPPPRGPQRTATNGLPETPAWA